MLRAAAEVPGWSVGEVRIIPDVEAGALLAAHPGRLVRLDVAPLPILHGDVRRVSITTQPPRGLCR